MPLVYRREKLLLGAPRYRRSNDRLTATATNATLKSVQR